MSPKPSKTLTTSATKANLFALLLTLPVLLVFGLPYLLFWSERLTDELNWIAFNSNLFMLLAILVVGIVLHELIHGAVWARYCKHGFKSIRFGVMWKSLSPYCHCTEPLTIKRYRWATLMPGVILGFFPCLLGIITGNLASLLFGLVFTLAAGGDFLMIWMLRTESLKSLVQDHPSAIGCYIFEQDVRSNHNPSSRQASNA